jgi:hypothetical protein
MTKLLRHNATSRPVGFAGAWLLCDEGGPPHNSGVKFFAGQQPAKEAHEAAQFLQMNNTKENPKT